MATICQSLDIKHLRNSVYQPQTDGLVERYNRTIKSLLKKTISDAGRDCGRKLPLVLYAIRTHEQSSMGSSPFKLVFGRQPISHLDMAAKDWDKEADEGKELVEYAKDLKNSLVTLRDKVHTHLQTSQNTQKRLYNRSSRLRELAIGSKVLILLPTTDDKLLAKWQGPYKILECLTPVTYRVAIPNSGRDGQIFHINLLKEWITEEGSTTLGNKLEDAESVPPIEVPGPSTEYSWSTEETWTSPGSALLTRADEKRRRTPHGEREDTESRQRRKDERPEGGENDRITEDNPLEENRPERKEEGEQRRSDFPEVPGLTGEDPEATIHHDSSSTSQEGRGLARYVLRADTGLKRAQ
ncbi:hypothetical protein NDU88_000250 [Pleurodeles waltl]|uniref:Integrase catalytic domain-containing protein n=1 Tax=Pleurodeles waltl TaxID=8319 RepID=A0AAV7TF39_PLEWA|nr:hypothetical protein NDU88_000250 [Pleurodeles waltl]